MADSTVGGSTPFSQGVSRRQLLAGAAAAVAAVPPLLAFPLLTAYASGSQVVTKADFLALVGTDFHVNTGSGRTIACRLESVTDLPIAPLSPPPAPGGEGFSLTFARTQRLGFGQGTYVVSHSGVGSFPLLLVPVGPVSSAHRCEAVINRLWS